MQETSYLYKQLLADPGHWKEYTLVIGESGVLVTNQGDRITFGSKSYSAEVRGSVIQLEGTTENPLTGLRIFGKTVQSGTPTPEAPVPLKSVGDGGSVTATVCGKNLLKVDFTEVTKYGVTFSPTSDGGVSVTGTTQNYPFIDIGKVYLYAEKKYCGSLTGTRLTGLNFRIIDRTQTPVKIEATSENSFRPTQSGWYSFEITINPGYDGTSLVYPQVELNTSVSIPTEFEQYNGSSVTISTPNSLPGIPVTSGGNYTDASGQQWICDEVDFARGVYVQRLYRYAFTGAVALSAYDSGKLIGTTFAKLGIPNCKVYKKNKSSNVSVVLCNVATVTSQEDCIGANIAISEWDGVKFIYFSPAVYGDVRTAQAAMAEAYAAGSPWEMLYELETPIETGLSAAELATYAALHTNYPNTTIFNDAGADMIVGYLLNGEGPINILVASYSADSGFRESSLISMSTQKSIFSDSNPSVGNCIAGQITVDMMKPKGDIPRRARLAPYVRLTNGVEHSEWIQKGVFFIDHREYSGDENERMVINGYDHIILTEDNFPSSTNEWPRTDIDVVRDIASEIGMTVDSRTVQIMNKGYLINYPAGYSMRETLENIAAMYAGSFIMSDTGELLLVTMFGIPKETSYLIDNVGFAVTFGGDRILV